MDLFIESLAEIPFYKKGLADVVAVPTGLKGVANRNNCRERSRRIKIAVENGKDERFSLDLPSEN